MRILRKVFVGFTSLILLLFVTGCSSGVGSYQSTETYNSALSSPLARAARAYDGIGRNPVVLIHGFLGSKLEDPATGKLVWGDFSTATFADANLKELGLPMAAGTPLAGLTSPLKPVGILADAQIDILGISFLQPGYQLALNQLVKSGYIDANKPLPKGAAYPTMFTFVYDWRRDIPESAAQLHKFLLEKRAELRKAYEKKYGIKDYDIQFDLIAHSMGGMLARYYLMYGNQNLPANAEKLPELDWRGAQFIDRLVVVATPNDGYLDTLRELVGGLELVPGAPRLPSGIIATFPSYYQMLPGPSGGTAELELDGGKRHLPLNLFDPVIWLKNRWGLANPKNDPYFKLLIPESVASTPRQREKIARDHLLKCLVRAKQFRRALSKPSTPPEGCLLLLFAGDAVDTSYRIRVNESGELGKVQYGSGDGKVLVSSARFDSPSLEIPNPPLSHSPIMWHSIYHIGAAHMGFFASDSFWKNARYNLLMQPTLEQRRIFKLNE